MDEDEEEDEVDEEEDDDEDDEEDADDDEDEDGEREDEGSGADVGRPGASEREEPEEGAAFDAFPRGTKAFPTKGGARDTATAERLSLQCARAASRTLDSMVCATSSSWGFSA